MSFPEIYLGNPHNSKISNFQKPVWKIQILKGTYNLFFEYQYEN